MKKIFFLFIVFGLFVFIFFESNAWQSYQETETRRNVDYVITKHEIRWDKFFNYIKAIPGGILERVVFKTSDSE